MKSSTFLNWRITISVIGFALICLMMPRVWAADAQRTIPLGESTITVGYTNYADQVATTGLAKALLEKLGYKVETVAATIGIAFEGVASGNTDVDFNAWLPTTHGAYWKKYQGKLVDLGSLYGPTRLGFAIPDYIPKDVLNSIEDLKKPEVKEKLDKTLTGIGAGAGMMRLIRDEVLGAYDLSDYTLLSSSGPAMTAALSRAIDRQEWIVVTSWTPHWMWARWDLRYLEDPKSAFGEGDQVHMFAAQGFRERFPRAAAFIENFHVPVEDVEMIMYKINKLVDNGTDSSEASAVAANAYIENHPDLVAKWLQLEPRSAGVKNDQDG